MYFRVVSGHLTLSGPNFQIDAISIFGKAQTINLIKEVLISWKANSTILLSAFSLLLFSSPKPLLFSTSSEALSNTDNLEPLVPGTCCLGVLIASSSTFLLLQIPLQLRLNSNFSFYSAYFKSSFWDFFVFHSIIELLISSADHIHYYLSENYLYSFVQTLVILFYNIIELFWRNFFFFDELWGVNEFKVYINDEESMKCFHMYVNSYPSQV